MTNEQTAQFQELLKAWNEHQDLRQQGAPVADLFASRNKLDAIRTDHYKAQYQTAA